MRVCVCCCGQSLCSVYLRGSFRLSVRPGAAWPGAQSTFSLPRVRLVCTSRFKVEFLSSFPVVVFVQSYHSCSRAPRRTLVDSVEGEVVVDSLAAHSTATDSLPSQHSPSVRQTRGVLRARRRDAAAGAPVRSDRQSANLLKNPCCRAGASCWFADRCCCAALCLALLLCGQPCDHAQMRAGKPVPG